MESAPHPPDTAHRAPYRAPRLRPIGTIADVTQAEGSGPGGFNSLGSPRSTITIFNNSSLDSDAVGRSVKPGR